MREVLTHALLGEGWMRALLVAFSMPLLQTARSWMQGGWPLLGSFISLLPHRGRHWNSISPTFHQGAAPWGLRSQAQCGWARPAGARAGQAGASTQSWLSGRVLMMRPIRGQSGESVHWSRISRACSKAWHSGGQAEEQRSCDRDWGHGQGAGGGPR